MKIIINYCGNDKGVLKLLNFETISYKKNKTLRMAEAILEMVKCVGLKNIEVITGVKETIEEVETCTK